ncbi:MAG: hypothetical protein B6I20_04025 [Bacteroidetes bacterium 4572_117]|nr:MAG: hypothetical protein B6I20_04025 [Bacteroidetes bacterium 4572_117]
MDKLGQKIKAAIFGLAIGDALGVPVEFKSRSYLEVNPVTDMIGYGTYMQAAGTWSDDSSLTFCLMQSLLMGYKLNEIAKLFVRWKNDAYWTAHDERFDIGITTADALNKFDKTKNAKTSGNTGETSNGNGSLMRIMPLAFHTINMSIDERFRIIKEVSSITHAHIRSVLACYYYIEFAIALINDENKYQAYKIANAKFQDILGTNDIYKKEKPHFYHILSGDIAKLSINEIESSGYVIHSLEASVWCLLNKNTYRETVLQAVNLGSDTDTTAAIVGGLAGLLYGYKNIADIWVDKLVRKDDILNLCMAFAKSL